MGGKNIINKQIIIKNRIKKITIEPLNVKV